MSVDDWARWAKRQADQDGAAKLPGSTVRSFQYKAGRVDGIVHGFDALLSDEAVEAGAQLLAGPFKPNNAERDWTRRILRAAIDAVTKEARND